MKVVMGVVMVDGDLRRLSDGISVGYVLTVVLGVG
jgi:hypothetical protein